VLILSSFLAARYAAERPFSISATLVHEQSYANVEGDSASSAELYALLSALAGVPIKQSLAVTGSVDQWGQVQAIGGVNEKIEGFFDLCKARGLTGQHGVVIPQANVKNLMLRRDVVEAAAAGQFHIYAVATIDEGITILTGIPAGEADEEGIYPEDSINGRIVARLIELDEKQRSFNNSSKDKSANKVVADGAEGEGAAEQGDNGERTGGAEENSQSTDTDDNPANGSDEDGESDDGAEEDGSEGAGEDDMEIKDSTD
jgi:hypothetical protein